MGSFKGSTSNIRPGAPLLLTWCACMCLYVCVCGLHDENLLKLLDLCISAIMTSFSLRFTLFDSLFLSTHTPSLFFRLSLWLHLILISKYGTSFLRRLCWVWKVCLPGCLLFGLIICQKKVRKRIPQIEYLHKFIETASQVGYATLKGLLLMLILMGLLLPRGASVWFAVCHRIVCVQICVLHTFVLLELN